MSRRMQRVDDGAARAGPGEGAAGAGPQAGDVAALLHWWALSGVDSLTADAPSRWLGESETEATVDGMREDPSAPARRPASENPATSTRVYFQSAPDPFASVETLEDLQALVKASHPNAPFADGNPASGILIMGEAPSAEDLRTGRPFTGPAGHLLDRMLAAIGLDRSGCYIALLAPRRRVPGPPPPDAVAADLPLAHAHVRLAAPRHIMLLGATASQTMTGSAAPIGKLRGHWLEVDAGSGPVPALATFNPAYLLRRPEDKALAWADLLAFRQRLLQ